jgi:F0F1-type ATP synthase assembly protein I
MQKEKFYKSVKIVGLISFIPMILVAGPLAGLLAAEILEKKFGSNSVVLFVCITIGFITSISEVIRIIRRVVKIDNKY